MGYYINIMAEPGTVPDRGSVVKAFENRGFMDRLELERTGQDLPGASELKPGREWVHLEQKFIASFYDKESGKNPGEWGGFRISWGASRERYLEILKTVIAFAKQSACRLYDPQMKKVITEENAGESLLEFEKLSERMKALFGIIQRKLE